MPDEWAMLVRLGGIGDNLVAASVLPHLKERYGHVEVMAMKPYHIVFEGNPWIDKLTPIEEGHIVGEGALGWQQWFDRRAKEFAFLINLSHSCETLTALSASQTQFYWPIAYRRRMCGHSYLEVVHDICGVPHRFGRLYYPPDEELDRARATAQRIAHRPLIGFVLSGSRIDKVYPFSPVLVEHMITDLGAAVVLFGADQHGFGLARRIVEHVQQATGSHHGVHVAISPSPPPSHGTLDSPSWEPGDGPGAPVKLIHPEPLWPLRRALATLRVCDVVVGPDTGLMWSVAMEPDIPKVVLLSHASAENITRHWRTTITLHADPARVPCFPCHRLHDEKATCVSNQWDTGAACISDISVRSVLDATRDALRDITWNRGSIDPTATNPDLPPPDFARDAAD